MNSLSTSGIGWGWVSRFIKLLIGSSIAFGLQSDIPKFSSFFRIRFFWCKEMVPSSSLCSTIIPRTLLCFPRSLVSYIFPISFQTCCSSLSGINVLETSSVYVHMYVHSAPFFRSCMHGSTLNYLCPCAMRVLLSSCNHAFPASIILYIALIISNTYSPFG